MLLPTPSGARRTTTVLAATVLSTVAATGTAAAAGHEFYGVEVDATVRTTYTGSSTDPRLVHESSLSTSTRVTAAFLAQIERDAGGRIIGAVGEDQHEATTTGSSTTREREHDAGSNDWYERGSSCVGAGTNRNDEGRTSLREDPITPLVGASMILNLADRLDVEMACTATGRHGGAGPGSFSLSSPLPDDPLNEPGGPLSVSFDLPEEATRAGKTIQLFEGPAGGQAAYCPRDLADRPYRTGCRVTFEGTITFTRQDVGGGAGGGAGAGGTGAGGSGGAGGAGTPGSGATTRPGAGVPASDHPAVPAPPRVPRTQRATLGAGGSRLAFRATCPTACRGTATIRVPIAGRGGRTRTLATVPVRLAAGDRSRRVVLTVPRRARRALLRVRRATVVVALTPSGGRRSTTTLSIRR